MIIDFGDITQIRALIQRAAPGPESAASLDKLDQLGAIIQARGPLWLNGADAAHVFGNGLHQRGPRA